MAATRGTIDTERSSVTRLGHRFTTARADTWQTFTTASVDADGSGSLTVKRHGETLTLTFGPESGPLAVTVYGSHEEGR